MILSEFILDLADQVISPLDHHVLGNSLVVGALNADKVLKLSWKSKNILVSVHEPLFLEVDTLLDEDFGHGNKIVVTTEVLALNLVILDIEVVFWASYDSEVGRCLSGQPDGDLHSVEFSIVCWVLHLFEDDALFHLSDVLLFDNSQEALESRIDLVWVELVALSDGFAQEIDSSLFGES